MEAGGGHPGKSPPELMGIVCVCFVGKDRFIGVNQTVWLLFVGPTAQKVGETDLVQEVEAGRWRELAEQRGQERGFLALSGGLCL